MAMRQIVTVAAVAALTTACASVPTTSAVPNKYVQTWTTPYEQTTCHDWQFEMTEPQRWAASADMLVNGRGVWKIDTMPSDSLVDKFENDISQGCQPIDTLTIADAATSLLLIGGLPEYGD